MQRIFILEGMVIGVLSWIIAILLVLPPGIIVEIISGKVDAPMDPGFSQTGVILWGLAIMLVFSDIANFYPAWKASRLTVNEVLPYE